MRATTPIHSRCSHEPTRPAQRGRPWAIAGSAKIFVSWPLLLLQPARSTRSGRPETAAALLPPTGRSPPSRPSCAGSPQPGYPPRPAAVRTRSGACYRIPACRLSLLLDGTIHPHSLGLQADQDTGSTPSGQADTAGCLSGARSGPSDARGMPRAAAQRVRFGSTDTASRLPAWARAQKLAREFGSGPRARRRPTRPLHLRTLPSRPMAGRPRPDGPGGAAWLVLTTLSSARHLQRSQALSLGTGVGARGQADQVRAIGDQ